jgi:hypothetical protein
VLREDPREIPLDHRSCTGNFVPLVLGGSIHGIVLSLFAARLDRDSYRSGGIDGNIVLGACGRAGRDGHSGQTPTMGMGREAAARAPLIYLQ